MSRFRHALSAPLAAFLAVAVAQGAPHIGNGDFEAGGEGVPPGWNVPEAMLIPASELFDVQVDAAASRSGAYGAVIAARKQGGELGREFGRLRQAIPADEFRGKQARLRGWLRPTGVSRAGAGLFLRIDGDDPNVPLAIENMMGWGIGGTTNWKQCEIVLDVPQAAKRIVFGASLWGEGTLSIDDLELERVEGTAPAGGDTRPLEGRGLDNLVAFTRLYGYVRYFHPSDEAVAADWDALAIAGVRAIEGASTPEALAQTLQAHFAAVAPTVRVAVTGQRFELDPSLTTKPEGQHKLIAWEHLGCGLCATNAQSIYSSERKTAGVRLFKRMLGGSGHSNMPNPDTPWTADLPGGVTVAVPMALYADSRGTLPHLEKSEAAPDGANVRDEPGVHRRLSPADRAVRLGDVVIAWNVFQHFYPYFDVIDTDWNASLVRSLTTAATDADDAAFGRTLKRMVADLHDGHGNVVSASDRARGLLPIAVDVLGGVVVVTGVHESIAGAGEIQPGDVIESFGGQPARDRIAELEPQISAATPGWMRARLRTELISGPMSQKIALGLRRGEESVREVTLSYGGMFARESRPQKIAEVRPGIWYVDIDRIDDNDFNAALDKLKDAQGLIFDLRGYPSRLSTIVLSHLIDEPITCARWNVPIVTRPDRTELDWQFSNWPVQPVAPRLTKNVAFIIGGGAISYAETYMGMVEHYKLATLVGETTAGTNGNINPFTVPGGYTVVWTGMKVLKHDRSRHHGVGITPTVPVTRTIEGIRAGKDEFLDKAIEVVSEQQ